MRILVVSLLYEPDLSATAYAVSSLVDGLVTLGHKVTVLAGMPHYGADSIYDEFKGKLIATERKRLLCVKRLWVYVPPKRESIGGKVVSWFIFNLLVTLVVPFMGGHDIALTLPPPYTLGLSLIVLKRLRGIPYIYNVQDMYPDIAVQQGLINQGVVFRFLRRIEEAIYRGAGHVTVISNDFRQNLLMKGIDPVKVTTIRNGFDTSLITPGSRHNAFSIEFGLNGCPVVMYAGNVGDSLSVETFVDAAHSLSSYSDVRLVVVGRGTALPRLEKAVQDRKLCNVRFLPFQPRGRVSQMYASSDIQLLLQRRGFATGSAPSKLLSIMCSGRPVVASIDESSDTARIVHDAGCGLVVPPEDPQALEEGILRVMDSPDAARKMGEAGRLYAEQNFSKEVISQQYQDLFERVVRGDRSRCEV